MSRSRFAPIALALLLAGCNADVTQAPLAGGGAAAQSWIQGIVEVDSSGAVGLRAPDRYIALAGDLVEQVAGFESQELILAGQYDASGAFLVESYSVAQPHEESRPRGGVGERPSGPIMPDDPRQPELRAAPRSKPRVSR
jgi:hypothetical protein